MVSAPVYKARPSGLFTSFVGPAIVKASTRPGSALWWEASRALSLQLTALVAGVAALILSEILGLGGIMFIGWLAWFALVFLGLGSIAAPMLGRFAGFAARG